MRVGTLVPILGVALVAGFAAILLRLPPLVGFLAAGFVVAALGVEPFEGLSQIADLGVTLLVFTIGLKLDVRVLLRREVWGTMLAHTVIAGAIAFATLALLALTALAPLVPGDLTTFSLVAFALTFSSTVLCVKILEERGALGSLYGQTAIGILVVQDLAAVAFMTWAHEFALSPRVLLLAALPPVVWIVRRMWERIRSDELAVLFGVALALLPGFWLFETVGLEGDLGALLIGMSLASHRRAAGLARQLFAVKELFLVGFFVRIGMLGLPNWNDLVVALVLLLAVLPVQLLAYVWLLRCMRLRNRTALLTSLLLGSFSEFAIIVADTGAHYGLLDERWVTIVAVAVAASFLFATLVNRGRAPLVDRLAGRLPRQDPARLLPRDRLLDTGDANALVLGMGRIGRAAYERLASMPGWRVLGVEGDRGRVEELRGRGLRVLAGDASDAEFWARVRSAHSVELVLLAMPHHDSNLRALEHLTASPFDVKSVAAARSDEHAEHLLGMGADGAINLYEGAGIELADHAVAVMLERLPLIDPDGVD